MKKITVFILCLAAMMIITCMPAFAEDGQTECAHQWSDWVIDQEADCTQPGEQSRVCELCGTVEKQEIPAIGHDWGAWTILKKASPYHKGKRSHICSLCEKKESAVIPKRKATANETASIKVVKRFFSAARTHDTAKMRNCFATCSKSYFVDKDSRLGKWSRKYNKNTMSWKVKDVQTSGKYVNVKIKVTYANGYSAFTKACNKWISWYAKHPHMNCHAAAKMVSIFDKTINKRGTKKASKTITLKCKHTSKGWRIEKPNNTLRNMVELYFNKASKDTGME